SARHELDGLDISEHGMWGYPEQFMPVPGGAYIHPDALTEPERRRAAAGSPGPTPAEP
ncbi:MAG: ammonium transporter, partial [Candidatus Dormibacteraeota bacterium]|nr:ammonium transporter [Candidatus Dormibacteraeota bacterium]